MLKYIKHIPGVLLLLATLVMGAYASPAYAASAPVLIVEIQAGGVGAATQEYVGIYNNSLEDVDITGWCVKNKTNVFLGCFAPSGPNQAKYLPAHSYAAVASSAMATYYNLQPTVVYTPMNQSSGSVIGSSDTISLVDKGGSVVDSHSWTTGITSGMIFMRQTYGDAYPTYINTGMADDWLIQIPSFFPNDQTVLRDTTPVPDLCANIKGIQAEVPLGYVADEAGDCALDANHVVITEVLPNASGSDDGREFIELYNPRDEAADLSHYQLWVGPNFEKSFSFPAGATIPAKSFVSFTNTDIPYSLLNTSSRVRLTMTDGIVIDETPSYQDPDDDMAWALIDGTWSYTNNPSPGAANVAMVQTIEETSEVDSAPKPCADNQYRSPETNRCRLVSSGQTSVTPCKDGQYRSEETNRCRNIAADVGPTPCAEGQERNPDTNRCRTIKSIATADYGVLGTQTKDNSSWYLWLAIGGLALVIIGYGIWEWRYEIGKLGRKLAVFARIRK